MDFGMFSAENLAGSVTVGGMCIAFLKYQLSEMKRERADDRAKREKLETKVNALENEKLAGLKTQLNGIAENCRQHQDNIELAMLTERTSELQKTAARFEARATELLTGMSKTRADVESFRGWAHDIRDEGRDTRKKIDDHAQNHQLHKGP